MMLRKCRVITVVELAAGRPQDPSAPELLGFLLVFRRQIESYFENDRTWKLPAAGLRTSWAFCTLDVDSMYGMSHSMYAIDKNNLVPWKKVW